MPPRAADQENTILAAAPVAGGSRLEQLPAELIQPIFDLLHIFDAPYQPDLVQPLSKHLHLYSTIALHRRIKITTFDDLCQICATTSYKATLGPLIQELEFYGYGLKKTPTDATLKSLLSRLVEGLLCTSLINLRTLRVAGWNLVGKVVLSERFGREGGRALESIKMYNCFKSIEGSLTEAWSHLRHLPVLASILYENKDPSIAAEAVISSNLGGFEKVTKLECFLHDFSSTHSTNFASLFPFLTQISLVHLNKSIRPNYSPFLDCLSPDSITSINLNMCSDITFTNTDQFPVHQSLTRFPRLQDLKFYDSRIFDSELIEAIHALNLTSFDIHQSSHLSYDLMHQLLSGIKQNSSWKKVTIGVNMNIGTTGIKYRDGAEPVVRNGNLIPGAGWKRPDWSIITLPEARELERISIEKGVVLDGPITWRLRVEGAFEEEEKWLEMVMKFMRTGPVDCTDCGKKN